eukprot:566434-Lingulodinium_polyedra.AAC.1
MALHELLNGLLLGLCLQVFTLGFEVPCHGSPNANESDGLPRAKLGALVGTGVPVLLATAVLRRAVQWTLDN